MINLKDFICQNSKGQYYIHTIDLGIACSLKFDEEKENLKIQIQEFLQNYHPIILDQESVLDILAEVEDYSYK